MAIRYSGDVEVRVTYLARTRSYRGRVRAAGGFALAMQLDAGEVRTRSTLTRNSPPASPECYDAVARVLLEVARKWALRNERRKLPLAFESDGTMTVRRTFQAPCPVRIKRRWGDG